MFVVVFEQFWFKWGQIFGFYIGGCVDVILWQCVVFILFVGFVIFIVGWYYDIWCYVFVLCIVVINMIEFLDGVLDGI